MGQENSKSEGVQIRRAGSNDEPGVLKCLSQAFEPYRGDYTPAAFADTVLDSVTIGERLWRMRVLVALAEDQVVGTIAGIYSDGEGHLRGMAVLPDFQGTGVAARLLREIEHWLWTQGGCTRITLDTTAPLKNAMRFYEKHGYRLSGRVSDFFGMPLAEYAKELT
jgi:tRNA (guanine37-N1)-methyltransferase